MIEITQKKGAQGWAMRALRRAALPPFGLSPQAVSVLRTAATIAGELLVMFVLILAILLPAIFGGA